MITRLLHKTRFHTILFLAVLLATTTRAQFTGDNLVGSWSIPEPLFYPTPQPRVFDVEGDGDLDIFVLYTSGSGTVTGALLWYENLGAGSFTPAVILYDDSYLEPSPIDLPKDYDLDDLDGDGDLDIAYVTQLSDEIRVKLFDNGAFGADQTWATGSASYLRLMQLDPWNNSLPDLVIHSYGSQINVLLNTGSAFGPQETLPFGQAGLGPDWLKDANISAAPVEFITYAGSHLYHYEKASVLSPWTQMDMGELSYACQVIDVDNDGDDDLAWSDSNTDVTGWLRGPGLYTPLVADTLTSALAFGTFGRIDCDTLVDLLSLRQTLDNVEPYISTGWNDGGTPELEVPSTATGLPSNGGGFPTIADLNGDGLNDVIMVVNDTTLHWYLNDGVAPEQVVLPPLDTLCNGSSGYVLPAAQPPGGSWYGQGVANGEFSAAGLGIGDLPIAYHAVDNNGCTVSGMSAVRVINTPSVSSNPQTWTPCQFIPLQFSASPVGGEWAGPTDGNGFVQLTPGLSGDVVYTYTDPTGGSCAALGGEINMGTPSQAAIGYNGPFCFDTVGYEVISVSAGNPANVFFQSWVDSVEYINSGVAILYYRPDTIGLDTVIISSSHPGACAGTDTLVIEVLAPPTVTLEAFTDTLVRGCENTYDLSGGAPFGGYYEGPNIECLGPLSLEQGPPLCFLNVDNAAASTPVTYYYTDGNGCTGSATGDITIIDSVLVTPLVVDQCPSPIPVQVNTSPSTAEWVPEQPITPEGLLDVSVPYNYAVGCYYTDVLGCQAFGYTYVNVREPSQGYAYIDGSEITTVCADADAFNVIRSLADGGEETIAFDPAENGPGIYPFVGYGDQQEACPVDDTLFINVVAPPSVSLETFTDTLGNSCGNTYTLSGGSPAGGTYSGNGVLSGGFLPTGLLGDVAVTYIYTDPNGCAASAEGSIHVIDAVTVVPNSVQQCVSNVPVQLQAQPQPTSWFDPVVSPTNALNTELPFTGPVYCAFIDATGCQVYGSLNVDIRAYSEGHVTTTGLDPVPGQLCPSTDPFSITTSLPDGTDETTLFDPQQAGFGDYQFIGYAQDDGSGCLRNDTLSFAVVDVPVVTLDAFPSLLNTCSGNGYTLFEGQPAGGVYSGDGVSDGSFYASGLSGNVIITYTFAVQSDCEGSATGTITLLDGVETDSAISACADGTPYQLSATPTGGTWSGELVSPDGIVSTEQDTTGIATYTYTDMAGCSSSADVALAINAPDVSLELTEDTLLTNGPPYTPSGGAPADGTYSGEAIIGGVLDPSTAGVGWHVIVYTFTDVDGCTASVSDSVYVESSTGIFLSANSNALSAWPVPAQDALHVVLPAASGPVRLSLVDVRGRTVLHVPATAVAAGRTITLATTSLSNGTYTLFAHGLANISPVRIIIAR